MLAQALEYRLPLELVASVFEFAINSKLIYPTLSHRTHTPIQLRDDDLSASPLEEYDADLRITIGLVCKTWKRIRDNTPRLWTRLDIVYCSRPLQSVQRLRWLLERSGALPLDIRLSCSSSEEDYSIYDQLHYRQQPRALEERARIMSSLANILATLRHSIPRWKRFTFRPRTRAEAYSAILPFSQPALKLEYLEIASDYIGDTVQALVPPPLGTTPTPPARSTKGLQEYLSPLTLGGLPPVFGGRTPQLQTLTLGQFAFPIDAPFFNSNHPLRKLTLNGGWTMATPFLTAISQVSSTLEELTIHAVEFRDAAWPVPAVLVFNDDQTTDPDHSIDVVLGSLKKLVLELPRTSLACILPRLKLPVLSSLTLRRSEETFEEWPLMDDFNQGERECPSTSHILNIVLNCMRGRKGSQTLTSQLASFSLTYGSVWEVNPRLGEEETDDTLREFLGLAGGLLEKLEVLNYSHLPSNLLQVSSCSLTRNY